jgi:hypothetical protein
MDARKLALRMHELAYWQEIQEESGGERFCFHGAPHGAALVTIDPASVAPAASFNQNRIYLCGTEGGLTRDGLLGLMREFDARGVRRYFVWLSPGPDLGVVREWLRSMSFSQVVWTRYPTMVWDGSSIPASRTQFDIRTVDAAQVSAARAALGDSVMEGYSRTLGKPGFVHYMAFDGQRPIAVGALLRFQDIGYLTYAGTSTEDRKRGAQTALIARRVADARALGCTCIVSQTLTMLRDSWSNLQKAGFREVFESEVYEYARG